MDELPDRPIPDLATPALAWSALADGGRPGLLRAAPTAYVPPIDLVLLGLGVAPEALDAPTVTVSAQFLRVLLSELARGAPFDADWYAAQYPDLEPAQSAGGREALHEHFVMQGYFEGRLPHEPALDAEWYFRHYRDVWATYNQKLQEELRSHYFSQGFAEGRAGTLHQAQAADRWIEAARRMGSAAARKPAEAREPLPEPLREAETAPQSAVPEQQLLRDFESLGWNCEFGLVQRHFSVEPIGLLSFSTIPFDRLCGALSGRFATLGEPDYTRIALHEQEYCVVDEQLGYRKHTWIYEGAADPDDLLQRECRKLNFQKAKLLRELQTGNKIFVYKVPRGLTEADISELYFELSALGDNTMLWVDLADDFHCPGQIELLFGQLYKGYIDTFSPVEAAASGISYSGWFEICAKVHRLWQKPTSRPGRGGTEPRQPPEIL